MKTVIEMAHETLERMNADEHCREQYWSATDDELQAFAELVRADEREAIYDLVMEAPFKEFDRQEEDFDGEAANAMKAMAFSLTAAIRARGSNT
jgi:ABC-type taurine transport system substrate-binding protein